MKMGKGIIFTVAMVVICLGGKGVAGHEHHVVGADRGWDPTSDLVSWSSGRIFRVGDQIWLAYSVAQGLVAELKSKEEYEACDVRNPIKMYREGLHAIPLESEGMRYFVSTQPQNCKNGLKLHIEVLPQGQGITDNKYSTLSDFQAAAPTTPSASTRYGQSTMLLITVLFFLIIYLAY
ncbi:hypothetical protein LR48_Vigan09g196700 [Vigna angularis]|uniref:Phytocyanin domain-containing protein n=2 Tax=Phaseolus angularis TaxID=3914 RepID=A0A0L9VE74_PHAAN|nr:uclacyanin 1 [Vigna angularis]KAG2395653.1 uncharacterized protein HKW66_Vig0069710 [Vigna angularis]KOM53308.1 hypothetical protein LR48_Vigan09g196700 [Vigna angularis]BAT87526.1 hypothetical protein VIGAN_05090800 [Vigna angularis var. angularis]